MGVGVLTVIDAPEGGAGITVTAELPVMPPEVAVTDVVPVEDAAVNKPAVVMVPPPVVAHVNVGCEESATPFWSRPVAVNCCVPDTGTLTDAGETAIVVRTGLATTVRVIVAVWTREPDVPVIVTV